ncbi:hypothetical protein C7S18_12720 [Ahniella affigens]|uniref:Uncharacterized protein n=1 Tax=Ahniella affigens TaxID=2021234 RepID=A0A2P1PT62_9GAMM|nr:hypothetical protein C7S18_12720 [Ahniella affigens]
MAQRAPEKDQTGVKRHWAWKVLGQIWLRAPGNQDPAIVAQNQCRNKANFRAIEPMVCVDRGAAIQHVVSLCGGGWAFARKLWNQLLPCKLAMWGSVLGGRIEQLPRRFRVQVSPSQVGVTGQGGDRLFGRAVRCKPVLLHD